MSGGVRLTQLSSTHNNLRTTVVEGQNANIPEVGHRLILIAEPLETDVGFRFIETSIIQSVEQPEPGVWLFDTENSRYKLEKLED